LYLLVLLFKEKEMNAGVEIILERIKTNPEEFCTKGGGKLANGKWSRVLENYAGHLEQEDIDKINDAIDKVNQDYFTEEVMTILAEGRDKATDEESQLERLARSINTNPQRVRLTSPDGAHNKIVTDKSQSFKDLLAQGWIDRRRMASSVTLNTGAVSGTWATPTITIPPTNK
jgi:hypothetical protein